MRDYPDGVRSAVLDSVLAPNEPYDTTIAQHFVEALEAVFRDCEAQDACRTAYPNLKARFYAALEQAERSPLTVSVSPPTTNGKTRETPSAQPVQVRLGSTELLRLVDISNTDALPSLPRLIDQIARRDAVALGPVAQNSLQPGGYAWGMRYSVWCGEEVVGQEKGRQTAQNVTSSVPPVLARVSMSTVPADVCKTWKVPPVPRSGLAPVRSLIPTLLIAGEYDPYTPAKWANAAAKTLPNGRVLTLKGMSHTPTQVWGQPCAMVVAATFVENPNNDPTRSAKGKCLESCRPPTFTTESATKQR
jgi:pimeloyl-ACP methyl ester carboxylesterase